MKGRKGPKLPGIIKPAPTPPPPAPPADLDKNTTITIDNKTFDIEADDLEVICELGNYTISPEQMPFVIGNNLLHTKNIFQGEEPTELWRK